INRHLILLCYGCFVSVRVFPVRELAINLRARRSRGPFLHRPPAPHPRLSHVGKGLIQDLNHASRSAGAAVESSRIQSKHAGCVGLERWKVHRKPESAVSSPAPMRSLLSFFARRLNVAE